MDEGIKMDEIHSETKIYTLFLGWGLRNRVWNFREWKPTLGSLLRDRLFKKSMQTFICHDERSSYYILSFIWEEPTTYSAGFPAASAWKIAENCISSIDFYGLVAVRWPSWSSNMGSGGPGTASEECRLEWIQLRRPYLELHTVVLSSTHH